MNVRSKRLADLRQRSGPKPHQHQIQPLLKRVEHASPRLWSILRQHRRRREEGILEGKQSTHRSTLHFETCGMLHGFTQRCVGLLDKGTPLRWQFTHFTRRCLLSARGKVSLAPKTVHIALERPQLVTEIVETGCDGRSLSGFG